jgi:hypothetical protein
VTADEPTRADVENIHVVIDDDIDNAMYGILGVYCNRVSLQNDIYISNSRIKLFTASRQRVIFASNFNGTHIVKNSLCMYKLLLVI